MFGRVSATAFGGSSMSMIRRSCVTERQWVTDDEYLDLVSLGNLLPGSNPINISLLVGLHVRGFAGAAVALAAATVPGFVILLGIGAFALNTHAPAMSGALAGCAACAVGLMGANAIEMTKLRITLVEIGLIVAVALAVLLLHVSLALALLIFIPISLVATRTQKETAP